MPTTNEPEKKVNVEIGMFIMDRTTGQIYEVVDLVPSIRPGNHSYVAKCEPVLYMGGPKNSTCHFKPIELNVDDAIINDFHKYMVFGNAVDPKRKLDLEQHIVRSDPHFDKKMVH